MLVDQPGWHLVIEDDTVPLPNLADACRLVTGSDCDYQVVKLHHWSKPPEPGLFDLPQKDWISAAAYLIRDTRQVLRAFRFLGGVDRMLGRIAR
jgi:hypothetical protein